ncbi:50S ribosomal protein L15 [Candidatus Magnetominusculus xianensis]|uniref:Large ribosomal subunit protein uL15 n=1 Tax=Candidatus Magnetominusculus xianensis TaxID=1748249 RepID=A0ABR5SDM7_9BACT|nr:50S ribosomal protein L15 [Candidatus Magnetominusculus xianensis]KWT83413.1 50S ribosomal protein L15 [Candidatus Magnetominusculus xianensis]MBF0403523.1 50S ribosomal protein L15 [Nitrospirota bacterium]
MRLDELAPKEGSTKANKRVGRGCGSGHGKTACKGHKGQKARSGGGVARGFEGGQMPLQRRLPKRGFKNHPFKVEWAIINLKDIEDKIESGVIDAGVEVTPELLYKYGIIKKLRAGLKVLATGELKRPVVVKANVFSKKAAEKITASGGQAVVLA